MFHKWAKSTLKNHKNKGIKINIQPKELAIIAMNTPLCQICDIKLDWFNKTELNGATLDRIDNELLIEKNNIQIICKQCNNLKGALTMEQFTKENNMETYRKNLMDNIIKNIKDMIRID